MANRPPPYRIIVIVEEGSGRDDDSGRCHYRGYLRNSTRITLTTAVQRRMFRTCLLQFVASNPNINDLMVIKTLEAISYHVYPHCATDTLLEASLDDENLIFVSEKPLKSDVQISILDIIARCYRHGHQFSPLLTVSNQYNDDIFKSELQGLINRKMVDIVRVARKTYALRGVQGY